MTLSDRIRRAALGLSAEQERAMTKSAPEVQPVAPDEIQLPAWLQTGLTLVAWRVRTKQWPTAQDEDYRYVGHVDGMKGQEGWTPLYTAAPSEPRHE